MKKEHKLTEADLDKAIKILATQLNEKGEPFCWYKDCRPLPFLTSEKNAKRFGLK